MTDPTLLPRCQWCGVVWDRPNSFISLVSLHEHERRCPAITIAGLHKRVFELEEALDALSERLTQHTYEPHCDGECKA